MPFVDHLNVPYLIKREGLNLDKVAIEFEGATRTYRELRERALRFGNALAGFGVKKGDRVVVLLNNCLEFWEINFGIWETGGVVVPLNTRLAPKEISHLVRRSGAKLIVFGKEHVEHVAYTLEAVQVDHLIYIGEEPPLHAKPYETLIETAQPVSLDITISLDDPAEIIYTSGTTGIPKGAVWTHGTVLSNAIQQCMDFHITNNDRVYVTLGMYYIGGRHDFTMAVFYQGGTVHIRRTGNFKAEEVLEYIEKKRISLILLVPVMLFDIHQLPDPQKYDLSSIRMIMCGGAPVPIPIIEKTMKLCPHTDFIQVYGSTEAGGTVTQLKREDSIRKIGSCGKPTLHNQIFIIDDQGRKLPNGEIGEIAVKGPSVFKEYWENKQETDKALGQGWLRTGDLGRFDEEGFLYVVGRKKDMIISGGMNIYPEEIEDVLRKHPQVYDAAVIGVPDERWGESVLAVIQTEEGKTISKEEIIAYCRENLASYKKPKYIEVIPSFPRTQSGKIMKHKLRNLFLPKYGRPKGGRYG